MRGPGRILSPRPASLPPAAVVVRRHDPRPQPPESRRVITLTHGMVLAAGLGLRMRPLTETTAKPLLTLNGRSLLDHALDRLEAAGVGQAVVNAHWQAEKVAAAVAARATPRLTLQREEVLL